MPFKSKMQMRWMFANKPATARKWAKETPNEKALPKRAPKRTAKKARRK